jgi:hypothetical protein
MCDYSLDLVVSRPAKVGDRLISTRFPDTMTRGFASVEEPGVAVCLLPGTELAFDKEVRWEVGLVFPSRRQLGHKVARFRQVNKDRFNIHRDALEFPDGQIDPTMPRSTGDRAAIASDNGCHDGRSAKARGPRVLTNLA